jgi:phosphinothricin acetyltransferase
MRAMLRGVSPRFPSGGVPRSCDARAAGRVRFRCAARSGKLVGMSRPTGSGAPLPPVSATATAADREAVPGAARAAVTVRDAADADADIAAIQAIYAHHVLYGLATFEEVPPTVDEIAVRRAAVRAIGLPYLVAEADGAIVGYCYATAYRPRRAYRYTIEDSVYVADGLAGRGIGAALLAALLARCEAGPWRQMIAIIGNSGNAGSIALHRRFGFEPVGTLRAAGFKLGRWVDTVVMQRALGPGDATPPSDGEVPPP